MAEPENHTLHLLREMREENRAFRKEMRDENRAFRKEMQERFDGMDKRFSGVEERLDRIESVFSGMAYLQADHHGQLEELTQRVERIEDKIGLTGQPAE